MARPKKIESQIKDIAAQLSALNAAVAQFNGTKKPAQVNETVRRTAMLVQAGQERAKERELTKKRRVLIKAAKADPNNRSFAITVKDLKGKKIQTLRALNWPEARRQKRDWYRIMRGTMKLPVTFAIEFNAQD